MQICFPTSLQIKKKLKKSCREILQVIKEQNKRLEEHSLAIKEVQRELRDQSKRLEEHSLAIKELLQELKSLRRDHDRSLGAIETRWSFRTERSFRDAIKAILEEDFGVKVESYLALDKGGEVFGKPDQVELDLIIRNGKTIAIEIKSFVSRGDVSTFYRKIKFYEKTERGKIDRAIIVSPMVDRKALELAKKFGFEVYGYPEEANFDD